VDFARRIADGDRVSVYPVFEGLDIASATRVRPSALRVTRFAADVHLGRLAGYLRLCGFDTLYRNDWQDEALAKTAVTERRILLTRDRGLLKRAEVTHGYLVRNHRPRAQLVEVLDRFDLWASLRPFTRCSVCNSAVEPVAKESVFDRLPPRTALYYEEFWRCVGCGRLYWQGAHYRSLLGLLSRDGGSGAGGNREAPPREERHPDKREQTHGGDADRRGRAARGGHGQRFKSCSQPHRDTLDGPVETESQGLVIRPEGLREGTPDGGYQGARKHPVEAGEHYHQRYCPDSAEDDGVHAEES